MLSSVFVNSACYNKVSWDSDLDNINYILLLKIDCFLIQYIPIMAFPSQILPNSPSIHRHALSFSHFGKQTSPSVVMHTFNPSTREAQSLSSRPASVYRAGCKTAKARYPRSCPTAGSGRGYGSECCWCWNSCDCRSGACPLQGSLPLTGRQLWAGSAGLSLRPPLAA